MILSQNETCLRFEQKYKDSLILLKGVTTKKKDLKLHLWFTSHVG